MADDDARMLLRDGDRKLQTGDHLGAAEAYATAARAYQARGLHLRAIALLFLQIRRLVATQIPDEQRLDDEARRELPSLYRALGLEADARAVENEGVA